MSNPYTTQTISGYNSAPPEDDGSQVSTNEIKWSTHKTKLGDPVKTLAEAINTETLAAFGLTFGQTISTHSTAYTVVAADRGKFLSVTGTTTITLIAVATAGDGFPLAIINTGTGIVTVDGSGAETINGSATIELGPDSGIVLTTNGSAWNGLYTARAKNSPVSGYVSGVTEYIDSDIGVNSTRFDVDLNIGAAWESIGPTGSGATNIWTALDSVPAGAKWVKLRVFNGLTGSTIGTSYSMNLHVRVTGSSTAIDTSGFSTAVSYTSLINESGSVENDYNIVSCEVPVDSSIRFDAYLYSTGGPTKAVALYLIGWGI